MKKVLVIAAAGLASFAVSTTAFAGDFDPWFAASRAGGFIDVWPAEDLTAVMFGAELQFHLRKSVYLDVSVSGAVAENFFTSREVRFAYGNPTIGAHYAGQVTRNFHFFVGGTFTLPFLHDPDVDVVGAAYYPSLMRGFYDYDRFAVGSMALRAMGGFEWNFIEPFSLRAELRPVIHIRTRDTFGTPLADDAELFIEHAAEFEGRFNNGFGLGARIQAVGVVTEGGDQAQVMFEPFLALTPKKRGFYMKLGFPLALDQPLGFGLDRDKLATGRIALGGQW
ncbi:MAG: hypothetical protein IPK82_42845 [Polyangiaceae bacterium]|nr:hypothetical protein [Polyangiaceae bacterium]